MLSLTVNVSCEKSGSPKIAAITGVSRSSTSERTSAVNAVPMTTATASSTTLPREMNSLNPMRTPPIEANVIR